MYESLVELFENSCAQYGNAPLFGTKSQEHIATPGSPTGGASSWNWLTYAEVSAKVDAFRSALAVLGVGPGDRVAIVADNCVEWAVAAYAVYGRGGCFVPMYVAQSEQEWEYILKDCEAKIVIGADKQTHAKLKAIAGRIPSLEYVVGIGLPKTEAESYEALLAKGAQKPSASLKPKGTDLAGYIYTSGTTGEPKGVRLSHGNLCSNVALFEDWFHMGQGRSLSFLPWAHAYGQVSELHFFVSNGASMALNDCIPNLVANLADVHPTVLVAVPRIFNRIYESVHKQMAAKPAVIQSLFHSGLRIALAKRKGKPVSIGERILLRLADALIFSKVRKKFGGKLELVINGSAALNTEIAEFVDTLGICVYEGYGLTETSPVVAANGPGKKKVGTVGTALPGIKVTLDETKSDEVGEGELIVHGPNVMQGYHQRPKETAAVMTADGGFRTGDLARIDEEGYITITGRIKEQYKLENGKYVAPANLEEEMKLSPLVANVMLFGANKARNVVLIVPEREAVLLWATEAGVTLGDWTQCEALRTKLMAEAKRCASFKNYEIPFNVGIIEEDFSCDNGLLTPTFKMKRRKIVKQYESLLSSLYT